MMIQALGCSRGPNVLAALDPVRYVARRTVPLRSQLLILPKTGRDNLDHTREVGYNKTRRLTRTRALCVDPPKPLITAP